MNTPDLEDLINQACKITMTPDQLREQRQSFAWGNVHLANNRITREMIAEADQKLNPPRVK